MRSDGFVTNVTLLVLPLSGRPSLEEYRRSLLAEVRTAKVTALRTARVDLPLGPAIRLSYRLHRTTARAPARTVSTLQYAFMHTGRSFVVTFATLPALEARYAPVFARSAASLRFS
jgi:hypothetical protein